jgi:hypothetical protein
MMAAMEQEHRYTVHAVPEAKGWQLRVEGIDGSAHARSLAAARARVRGFLASLPGDRAIAASDGEIDLVLDLDGLDVEARASRRAAQRAAEDLEAASRRTREIARALRARGLSVTDTAAVLGVSQARASQLLHS